MAICLQLRYRQLSAKIGAQGFQTMPASSDNMEDVTGNPHRGSAVEKSYRRIQDMVISFAILPGERINESELSRKLGVSRTPLREALNRLVSEGFVDFVPARGFFRKKFRPNQVFDLIEFRVAIETAAARIAINKLSDRDIRLLRQIVEELSDMASLAPSAIVPKDELFHETLTGLSGNNEMLQALRSVNIRIRSLRYLGVNEQQLELGHEQHVQIVEALARRDGEKLVQLLDVHIARSLEDIERAVRELYGKIYVDAVS